MKVLTGETSSSHALSTDVVEQAFTTALERKLPWHLSRPIVLLGLGITIASITAIASPIIILVWAFIHINFAALSLGPLAVAAWITSYRIAVVVDHDRYQDDRNLFAIFFGVIATILTGMFITNLGQRAFDHGTQSVKVLNTPAAAQPLTDCSKHGGILRNDDGKLVIAHYDSNQERGFPTRCSDGASLDDAPL